MEPEERAAWIALAACPALVPSSLRSLLQSFGSARAVYEADAGEWAARTRMRVQTQQAWLAWRKRHAPALSVEPALAQRGIRCVLPEDIDYPEGLRHLQAPPAALFVSGPAWPWRQRSLAVVGTRRASRYGLEVAAWIGETLAAAGWNVISGLALGIDGAAQKAALDAGCSTAVLACGVDLCYPPAHQSLYQRLRERGALISEYAPGTPVQRYQFPERNRLIAALAEAVVVVQAGEQSGALVTADWALELGREVYAVPGPITSVMYKGSNRLLQSGARVLIDPADLLADFGVVTAPQQPASGVPARWRELYEALGEGATAVALAAWLQQPLGVVYGGLLELEMGGWAEKRPGGVYAARPRSVCK
ncbi:MAG: DNA-processing protein DprA [Alicyclobacillus sp.]|nr:DNA-processing protein DprA [Alicyclobacillus sp.]